MHKSVYALPILVAGAVLAAVWPEPVQPALVINPKAQPFAPSLVGTIPDGTPVPPPVVEAPVVKPVVPAPPPREVILVLDENLRRLFDYYLSVQGEQPLRNIIKAVDIWLDKRFAAAAAKDAKNLFRRYLYFKRALATLEADPNIQGNALVIARKRLDSARVLRSRYFSQPEVAGLFGWGDRYDDDAMARMEIQQDRRLTDDVRRSRLTALDGKLDPETLAARQQPVEFLALAEQVAIARKQGADDAAVFRLRAASVGEDAAVKLAALDREEIEWKRRIEHYKQSLVPVRNNSALDESQRQVVITAMRESYFNAQERLRLVAYE
ncbi:lipase secretion chaperone [Chitinimonas sp. PSY-7]|uniref:lipase secretion chaperone n=1 Tax=Chitinimonas sp. PSY-7 TaxID=3459088 RepID=UPI00403FD8E9